jgi:hypothetical protein
VRRGRRFRPAWARLASGHQAGGRRNGSCGDHRWIDRGWIQLRDANVTAGQTPLQAIREETPAGGCGPC